MHMQTAGVEEALLSKKSAWYKYQIHLKLCVSSLRRGHANLLCIVPILIGVRLRRGHELIRMPAALCKTAKLRKFCVMGLLPSDYWPADPCSKSTFSSSSMAKSLRSKSQRKKRALKREKVFKPVEDARTQRIASKLGPVERVDTAEASTPSADAFVQKHRRNRRMKHQLPNTYGLSAKETHF